MRDLESWHRRKFEGSSKEGGKQGRKEGGRKTESTTEFYLFFQSRVQFSSVQKLPGLAGSRPGERGQEQIEQPLIAVGHRLLRVKREKRKEREKKPRNFIFILAVSLLWGGW